VQAPVSRMNLFVEHVALADRRREVGRVVGVVEAVQREQDVVVERLELV